MILSKLYLTIGKAELEAFVSQLMGKHLDSRLTNQTAAQNQGPGPRA